MKNWSKKEIERKPSTDIEYMSRIVMQMAQKARNSGDYYTEGQKKLYEDFKKDFDNLVYEHKVKMFNLTHYKPVKK